MVRPCLDNGDNAGDYPLRQAWLWGQPAGSAVSEFLEGTVGNLEEHVETDVVMWGQPEGSAVSEYACEGMLVFPVTCGVQPSQQIRAESLVRLASFIPLPILFLRHLPTHLKGSSTLLERSGARCLSDCLHPPPTFPSPAPALGDLL